MGKLSRRWAGHSDAEAKLAQRAEARRLKREEQLVKDKLSSDCQTSSSRKCLMCKERDALLENGQVDGLSCCKGHAICYLCSARLVESCDEDCECDTGISYNCPICKRQCSLSSEHITDLIEKIPILFKKLQLAEKRLAEVQPTSSNIDLQVVCEECQ